MNKKELSIDMFSNKKRNRCFLAILIIVFLIFEVAIWVKTNGFPAMKDQSETYVMYASGKNYARFGVVGLGGVDDYALGSSREAHPYYATNMGAFSTYYSFFLQKIGIKTIPAQTFSMIFVLAAGLVYLYFTVREYTGNELAALLTVAVSVFDYSTTLIHGFNLYRSWTWLFIFGTLYHLRRYSFTDEKRHFCLCLLYIFLLGYQEIILTLFLTVLILFFKIFKFYNDLAWKKLIIIALFTPAFAFGFHKLLVIQVLGLETFIENIKMAFLKRLAGVSSEVMKDFYHSNGIVLWSQSPMKLNMLFLKRFAFAATQKFSDDFGSVYPFVVSVFGLACVIRSFFKISVGSTSKGHPDRFDGESDNRFFAVFVLAALTTCVVIPFYVYTMYINVSAPFLVFTLNMGGGILLSKLFRGIALSYKRSLKTLFIAFSMIFIFIIVDVVDATYRQMTLLYPIKSMPASDVLHKYKGHSFVTNYQGCYVNYFTGEWAKMVWYPEKTADEFIMNMEYVHEKDRITNKEKYKIPDFLLVANNMFAYPGIILPERSFKAYSLVEKGEDFWIFNLKN